MRKCINLGSYNYLGFAESGDSVTAADVRSAVRRYGLALCSPRAELGTTPLHLQLENTMAHFLGVEVRDSVWAADLLDADSMYLQLGKDFYYYIFSYPWLQIT